MGSLFLTGTYRSGSTLLEKLLCNHPHLSVLSQPFPHLYFKTKTAFFAHLGLPAPAYVLGDLFLEDRYGLEDFSRYLSRHRLSPEDLRAVFRSMEGYSGRLTSMPKPEEVVNRVGGGSFLSVFQRLLFEFRHRPQPVWTGTKEILAEEFIPFFLEQGVRVILLLRDPRDMLASLNTGEGARWTGKIRPTLLNVRNWRKSAAFALALDGQPNFRSFRYEDLAADPFSVLDRITEFLEVPPFSRQAFEDGILDQSGGVWSGNSSHDRRTFVSLDSVGAYGNLLPPEVIRYVEILAGPEMAALGYPAPLPPPAFDTMLHEFREPYPIERQEVNPGLSSDPEQLNQEIHRLEACRKNSLPGEEQRYFLFPRVHAMLNRTLADPGREASS